MAKGFGAASTILLLGSGCVVPVETAGPQGAGGSRPPPAGEGEEGAGAQPLQRRRRLEPGDDHRDHGCDRQGAHAAGEPRGQLLYDRSDRQALPRKVVAGDKVRIMALPQMIGACNSCHTQNGANMAPDGSWLRK
jgi:hypothetical protein